jgi:tetratricopeptide (TPR) repeat protein
MRRADHAFLTAGDISMCLSATGDEAIEACSRILALNPNDPHNSIYYFARGDAYIGKSDYDRAIDHFGQVIWIDPIYAGWAYSKRGNAYIRKGDYDRALSDFDQAIALATNDASRADAYDHRGSAYYGRGDYDRAIADFDRAISDYDHAGRPQLAFYVALVYVRRGRTYYSKGDYERAISDYDQAIRLEPKAAMPYSFRGEAYDAKNDPDHAITDFAQALKLDPSLVDAQRGRARVQALLTKES